MLPPDERTEPARGPRHAADGRSDSAVWPSSRPYVKERAARHRRPESLADVTRLRPVSAPPLLHRSVDALFEEAGEFEDSFIERGFEPAPLPVIADQKRRTGKRGKHAASGGVRDWALYTGDKPPATGSHRAPGTLPIESWLLVGKSRQQALLATAAAVGLMLIVLPMQQHTSSNPAVSTVSAAEQAAAVAEGRASAIKPTGATPGHANPADDAPAGKPAAPAPTGGVATTPAATSATPAPAAVKPTGAGPANSLRTTGGQAVALTFDDGPDPVQTPKILATLAENDVKATFCLVGEQVRKHPEIVRQIVAAGHTLCNHTWDHSLVIGKQTPEQIEADLEKTTAAIQAAAPGAPVSFFRAPGGNFTERLVSVATAEGMTSLYWQVDPRDWDHPEGEKDGDHVTKVVDGIKQTVRPGSIVLSHDFNQPDTIKAYEVLLPWLKDNFELGLPPRETPAVTPSEEPAPAETTTAPPTEVPSEPSSAAPSGT